MMKLSGPLTSQIGRIGVFLGGKSRERAVSIRSGNAVYGALKRAGFQVSKIDTANGFRKALANRKIDFAFPALHGTGGEDGTVQKILRRYKIPYVGSDPHSSARAFDKWKSKREFVRAKIPTPKFALLTRGNWRRTLDRWVPPYVLKPVEEGSSIDVSMVRSRTQGRRLVKRLLKSYERVLIEEMIVGREYTVSILGGRALPVIEIRPKRPFYDYKAKYTKGLTEYVVPAPISRRLDQRLRNIALQANRELGLRDLSRVDFMVDRKGKPYVLEVNSIPGFTETSLLPKAARHVGIDFTALCVRLIELASKRERSRK